MVVKRIVCDIAAEDAEIGAVAEFYRELFELDVLMDLGWILTLGSGEVAPVQISIAKEGGGGAPVPDISIEVDDVNRVYARACSREDNIAYDLRDEPWGVRRFFVTDPTGKLVNVLSHKH